MGYRARTHKVTLQTIMRAELQSAVLVELYTRLQQHRPYTLMTSDRDKDSSSSSLANLFSLPVNIIQAW